MAPVPEKQTGDDRIGVAGKIVLGVDTGGTFTDLVLFDGAQLRVAKVLSTPEAPEAAILEGLRALGLDPEALGPEVQLIHGTTVATNAALENTVARTAYLGQAGFEDLLALGRQQRPALYDLTPPLSPPPVAPELCFGAPGRLDAAGKELAPLDDAALDAVIDALFAAQPEAVAINFLFAWKNPAHEAAAQARLEARLAARGMALPVSRSSEVLAESGEYERGLATWLNASLSPLVTAYLQRLETRLGATRLAIMASHGGTVAPAYAARFPVQLLLSGPAGGVAGLAALAQDLALPRVLSFDMGGTSTDVTLIDGAPQLTHQSRIGPYPVAVPMVAVHTIGAGGGSLASLDAGGALLVGPASAGARPGPACYGQGGTAPTVTDAHVILGRLPTDQPLGGQLTLDPAAAYAALRPLADALGCSLEAAAEGILAVANDHMAKALRVMSLEQGTDPRDCVLASFGGAGGLHLCELAEALDIEDALLPAHGGVLSAFGMLASPPARLHSQALRCPLDEEGLAQARAAHDTAAQQIRSALGAEGVELEATLALQYAGQGYALEVPFRPTEATPAELTAAFEASHETRYGYRLGRPLTLERLRVRGTTPSALAGAPVALEAPTTPEARPPWAVTGHGSVPRYRRSELREGDELRGPAILEETTATHWLAPGWRAECLPGGHLRLKKLT